MLLENCHVWFFSPVDCIDELSAIFLCTFSPDVIGTGLSYCATFNTRICLTRTWKVYIFWSLFRCFVNMHNIIYTIVTGSCIPICSGLHRLRVLHHYHKTARLYVLVCRHNTAFPYMLSAPVCLLGALISTHTRPWPNADWLPYEYSTKFCTMIYCKHKK